MPRNYFLRFLAQKLTRIEISKNSKIYQKIQNNEKIKINFF